MVTSSPDRQSVPTNFSVNEVPHLMTEISQNDTIPLELPVFEVSNIIAQSTVDAEFVLNENVLPEVKWSSNGRSVGFSACGYLHAIFGIETQ